MSKLIAIGKAGRKSVFLNLAILLKTRMLITANSGGGKSYLMRLLAELLFPHVMVIIIDPEGEFASLRTHFDYALVGPGGEAAADVRTAGLLAERLLENKISAICDISELKPAQRHQWVRIFIEALMEAPKKLRKKLVIFVDEAHKYVPEAGEGKSEASEAMLDLATRGRKRGYCPIFASQRHAKVSKNATAELLNRLVGPTFESADVERAVADLSIRAKEERQAFTEEVKMLEEGNFNALGRAISKTRVLFKVDQVQTHHPEPGESSGADEPPPPREKVKALLAKLADLPKEVEAKAKNEAELRTALREVQARLATSERAVESYRRMKQTAPLPKVQVPAAAPKPVAVKPKIVKVDVQVIDERKVHRLEMAMGRAEKLYEKLKLFGKPVEEAAKELRAAIGSAKLVDANAALQLKMRDVLDRTPPPTTARAPLHGQKAPPRAPIPAAKPLPPAHETPELVSVPGLNKSQRKMLQTLEIFRNTGITEVPRSWMAGWMGITVSGTFLGNLSGLRTGGYIDYVDKKVVLKNIDPSSALDDEIITGPEMLTRCCSSLNSSQQQMLTTLYKAEESSGAWLTREELAESLGITVSGTFLGNLSGLHTAELVDYGSGHNKGAVRACEWVFGRFPVGVA